MAMGIEEDIQQSDFNNEYHKALINLLYTHNHIVGKMGKVFKTYDITRQQYNVLRILRGQYPKSATINVIRERMLEKMSDTSRMVVRLSNKGLIDRSQSKGDRREAHVSITNKGLNLLNKMDKTVSDFDLYFEKLSEDDARKLNSLLDNIRKS